MNIPFVNAHLTVMLEVLYPGWSSLIGTGVVRKSLSAADTLVMCIQVHRPCSHVLRPIMRRASRRTATFEGYANAQ